MTALEIMIGQLSIKNTEQQPERHAAGKHHVHHERNGFGLAVPDDVQRLGHEGRRGQYRGQR